ncbi:DUF4307 domain-containing protein [Isoptericola variabilis]|nr:DUF4307 domain-containing protein [Isoptericola variabilis]
MSDPAIPTPPADRYGTRGPGGQGADRRLGTGAKIAIGAALAAGVAGAAWLAAEQTRQAPVTVDVVGFTVPSPEQIDVTFQVHMPRGTTAVCTVDALSQSYAQVGTLEVPVGPSEGLTSRHTVTVRTSEEATTAVVDRCVVTE